eukprot:scaffold1730_cov68-Phaeocystis_antarctica.AAC.10
MPKEHRGGAALSVPAAPPRDPRHGPRVWQAGVTAVPGERASPSAVHCDDVGVLLAGDEQGAGYVVHEHGEVLHVGLRGLVLVARHGQVGHDEGRVVRVLAHHVVEGERGAHLRLELGGGRDVLLGHHLADDLLVVVLLPLLRLLVLPRLLALRRGR